MLTFQFFAQNLHFAITLFAALVFFAVFWLYFDAWLGLGHRRDRSILKWGGFVLLSLSFVAEATVIEQANFGRSIFGDTAGMVAAIIRLVSYVAIILSELLDPLQKKPETKDVIPDIATEADTAPAPTAKLAFGLSTSNAFGSAFALPVGALAIAARYWRRATTGIERHLKPVAYAFSFLFLAEVFNLAQLLRNTDNPTLFNLVQAFGPLWIAAHIALLCAAVTMGRWVWKYLTERFLSQIFMTFVSVVLAIFLLTTVSFTFLLLRNIQDDALNNLATATNVLQYALDSRKASTQANAESVAADPSIIAAVKTKNHRALDSLTGTFLETKKQSSLVITSASGQVLLRAEDPARWGDSISSDTLVRRALIGTTSSTVDSQSGVLAPVVSIRSTVPIRASNGTIIGTASVATIINNAFVDGIKKATGLETAIYSGNIRAATTFTGPDGISRWVGVKETSSDVQDTVLKHGDIFKGQLDVLNRQYLAVYAPLKNADQAVIGMLFIGQPEITTLQTTSYLIRLTFIVSVILLAVAIIPAYMIARHITKQLE